MDIPDLAAQGSEQQKRIKVLTLEQQRKFEELRERRLQLQKAQDAANSRKKKKRKRGKKGTDMHPEAADGASEQQHDHPSAEEEERTITDTAAKSGSEHRHIFAVNAGTGTAGEGLVSQSSGAGGGEGNLDIVPSTTEKSSSGIAVNPDKTPAVPPQKTKRKKLHWGMEIKERWERKGNM